MNKQTEAYPAQSAPNKPKQGEALQPGDVIDLNHAVHKVDRQQLGDHVSYGTCIEQPVSERLNNDGEAEPKPETGVGQPDKK